MLRAEELMVGDWVHIRDWVHIINDDTDACFDARVEVIDMAGNVYVKATGDETAYPYSVDWVESIPITPEILEKNGFEEFDGWRILDMDDVEIRWIGTILEISGSRGNMELPNVQCVHELQHAIRLCGIDKTIEL